MNLPLLPTRRALLKGACASLLLPLLPSLSWADDPAASIPKPPKRWVTIMFPNGVWPDDWWAKGTGRTMELSKTLLPLADHRGSFSVINDLHLFDKIYAADGPHTPYFSNILSGAKVPHGPLVLAESCDQVLARTIGQESFMPSMALGIEPMPYGLQSGAGTILSATISWSSPTSPVPPMISPRDAFDALFDVKGLVSKKSLLDCLMGDVSNIHGKISLDDARKLDEYTETIRDLERRIERTVHPPTGGWKPTITTPDMLRPAQNAEKILQQNLGVRQKLMMKIMALSLRMDKTRVATLVMGSDGTYATMGHVPGVANTGWHSLAHHAAVAESIKEYQLTNEYHVKLFASFLDALKSVDEGGHSLLDNSMILFGSNVMDGNLHDASRLPLILAGGGGGTLTPGANLNFTTLDDRRVCNLHLAMLQRMGVTVDGKPIQKFGTSVKPLEGI
jgi:hypothetical protein